MWRDGSTLARIARAHRSGNELWSTLFNRALRQEKVQ